MTDKQPRSSTSPFRKNSNPNSNSHRPGRAAAAATSRPGAPSGLRSRFGSAPVNLHIVPVGSAIVCFSLEGLGGSLRYILGDNLPVAGGNYETILESTENDQQALKTIQHNLDSVWADYDLQGAMLVYQWEESMRDTLLHSARIDNSKAIILRAFDPMLVLNVLARARENLLQPGAPLALEKSYLERTLISDDQRLVRLVQTSGYFEEALAEPPAPPDEAETVEE